MTESKSTSGRAAAQDAPATAARVSILLGSGSMIVPLVILADAVFQAAKSPLSLALIVQSAAGLALLVGGVALKREASWGRKLIVLVAWSGIAWVILFPIYFIVTITPGMALQGVLGLGALAVLVSVFWLLVLRRALRFMGRPELLRYTHEA